MSNTDAILLGMPHATTQDLLRQNVQRVTLFSIVAFLFVTCTIVDENRLPVINLGGASIHIADMLCLPMVAVSMRLSVLRHTMGLLVFLMLAWHMFSGLYGAVYSGSTINMAVREYRFLAGYVLFFPVFLHMQGESAMRRIFGWVNALGVFVALAMFAQYVLGPSVPILPGRVEELESMGQMVKGVTRLLPPGQTLIYFCLTHAVAELALQAPGATRWKVLRIAIFGFAILLTFNRSYWATLMATTTILLALSGFRRLMYGLASYAVVAAAIVCLVVAFPQSRLSRALLDRAGSLVNIGGTVKKDDSLHYREREYKEAWNVYIEKPFFGIGLGNTYRKLPPKYKTLEGYTHNGYLWAALKAGLVGILIYAALFVTIVAGFIGNLGRINRSPAGTWIKANFAFLLSIYAGNIVNPLFYQRFSVPLIALALAFMANSLANLRKTCPDQP